ncbi:MAG: sulfotransferase, partial [Alphaproteobacteria bacterium]
YVPAMAAFLRDRPVPCHRVRYEEFVRDPERGFRDLCDALGLPFEAAAIDYGRSGEGFEGLGDPTGVARHDRPVTSSVARWAAEVASVPATDALVRRVIDELDPADLDELGYPRDEILAALDAAKGAPAPERRRIPMRYALERRLLVALRRDIHRNALGRALKKLRFALDVVLRE